MANTEMSHIFHATVEKCFEGLLFSLKSQKIDIVSSNPTDKTIIARWTGGMSAKFTTLLKCRQLDDGTTSIESQYRRDLTPGFFRPMGSTPPPEYNMQVRRIFNTVKEYLSPEFDTVKAQADIERRIKTARKEVTRRLIIIAILSVVTGLLWGLLAHGFNIHGFTTALIVTLVAWVVYSLLGTLFIRKK
jgi:hypothetical protein